MKRHNGIVPIVLAGQKRLCADGIVRRRKLRQHFLDLRDQRGVILLISHLDQCLNIFKLCRQRSICGNIVLHAL